MASGQLTQKHGYNALQNNLIPSNAPRGSIPQPPSSRRLHPHMLIRQPKHHLPIRRRAHIIPRIPLHHARPPLTRQPAHGLNLLGLHLHLPLRIPHNRVPISPTAPNQIPPVRAKTHIALTQRSGRAGRRAHVRGGVGALAVGAEGAVEGVEEEVALGMIGC